MTTASSTDLPAAVLWDMDGTLVDTEPYWMASEVELVRSFGGEWSHEDGLKLVGSGLWNSAAVLQDHGVRMGADEIVYWLTDRVQARLGAQGVPLRPGAEELLRALRAEGVATALVTMSVRRMAEQIASLLPFEAFDVIVAGDEVERPKPDPEPYLLASRKLGIDPRDAIAIEDSIAGVRSAVSSGAVTIGVPHMIELPEGPDHVLWPSLAGRGVADLRALFRERRPASATVGERP